MTREQHLAEAKRLSALAGAALEQAVSEPCGFSDAWPEYKRLSKLVTKHRGIARAMWTRSTNKLLGYKAF